MIHHGLDFSNIGRKTNYQQNGKLKILTVAALESWKGIQHIISAFNDIEIKQNFEYHIIGEGSYRDQLSQDIKTCNAVESVFLHGNKENVESLYCNYDIYCQLSDGEALDWQLLKQCVQVYQRLFIIFHLLI